MEGDVCEGVSDLSFRKFFPGRSIFMILCLVLILAGCSFKSAIFSKDFPDFQNLKREEKAKTKKESIAVKERKLSLLFQVSIPDKESKTVREKEPPILEMQRELLRIAVATAIFPLPKKQYFIDLELNPFPSVFPGFQDVKKEESPKIEKESITEEKMEQSPPSSIEEKDKEIKTIGVKEALPKKVKEEPITRVPPEEELPKKKGPMSIPLVMNRSVEVQIAAFQNPLRSHFELWLSRSTKYESIIKDILQEYELPEELLYLALIESGYSLRARSPKKASGPWQFMGATAKRYGLKINWWIDERRDIEKSTRAAARYLKYLYGRFQDWELALAAYNAGEGKIARAIRRYKTRDFWKLRRYRYLSRETRSFVPKFMAALAIAKDPDAYGFSDIKFMDPLNYEEVTLTGVADLRLIANVIDCSVKNLKELNPQLKRGYIPSNVGQLQLKIPAGKKDLFLYEFSKMTGNGKKTFGRHTIRTGESLSVIAEQYSTSIKALMDLNELHNSHLIIAGKSLLVPTLSLSNNVIRTRHLAKVASSFQRPRGSTIRKGDLLYRVRQGDTLWKIAKQYGLTVSAICKWNDIKYHSPIYPGDQLILRIGSL